MRSSDGEEQLEIAFCFTFCAFCCAFSLCFLLSMFTCVFAFRYTFSFSALYVVVVLNFVYSRLFPQFVFCFSHSLQNRTEFVVAFFALLSSSFAYQYFSLDSAIFGYFFDYLYFFCILSLSALLRFALNRSHTRKKQIKISRARNATAEQGAGAVPTAFCPPITADLSISRSCVVAWESAHTHTQARTHTLGEGGGRDGGGGRIKKLKRASRRLQNKPVKTHSLSLSRRLSFRFARLTGVCNCSTRETFKHNKLQLKLLPYRRPQHTTA